MTVQNTEIAAIFEEIADLLELEGANPFRVRAYRAAAQTCRNYPKPMAELVQHEEDISALQGIGKDLSQKIAELVQRGSLEVLSDLQKRNPPELRALLRLSGLGPKRLRILHEKLGVTCAQDLERVAQDGKIKSLEGFGAKTEQNILAALARFDKEPVRYRHAWVEGIQASLVAYLEGVRGVECVVVAGSFRRFKETVKDLDILVVGSAPKHIMDRFVAYEGVSNVLLKGDTKTSVRLVSGLQVDVRVVSGESFGAALLYFTGSKEHNIALRRIAQSKGLKINEYGVFKGSHRVAGATEQEIYAKLELTYIEPELREQRGEIEAAQQDAFPKLVQLKDIRGDLHVHSNASDGQLSLAEIATIAASKGYDYVAITDHTQHLAVAGGLTEDRLWAQIEAIDQLNETLERCVVLKSTEVDILEDGSLDLSDHVLRALDLTVCSIHSRFNLSREKQTERILRAMDNPHFNILGHPSGRLLGRREPYDLDMDRVLYGAQQRGCCVELNAQPDRLDVTDVDCMMAKDLGVKVSIATDAHTQKHFDHMKGGVMQARRGWLRPGDVLNTVSLKQLKSIIKR